MKQMMMALIAILFILSLVFAIQGINMHSQVVGEEAIFHAKQSDYLNNAKSVRDSAKTGSELNKQLAEIANTPSELLRLKLVGIGKILTGIYILLFAILIALIMMPMRLGMLLKGKKR